MSLPRCFNFKKCFDNWTYDRSQEGAKALRRRRKTLRDFAWLCVSIIFKRRVKRSFMCFKSAPNKLHKLCVWKITL